MKHLLHILFIFLPFILSSQDFTINQFDSDITVNENGSLDIEERISVTFTKRKRGIYRVIPTRYSIDGKSVKLGLESINVLGDKQKVNRKKDKTIIRIGDSNKYINGAKEYKIKYHIKNGIQSFDDHQQLYIDITGNEWKAEIQKVNYQIHLPKSLSIDPSLLKSTTGKKDFSKGGATLIQDNNKTISGSSNRLLKEGEGVTIAIGLPSDYISHDELIQATQSKSNEHPQNPWLLGIPLGLLALFINFWKNLKSRFRRTTNDEYSQYPPEGYTSAHIGAYIDQTAHTRDMVSLIPYWAAEGYIEMEKTEDDTVLLKKKPLSTEFPDYEHTIFNELFRENDVSSMSSLKNNFYSTMSKAKAQLTKEVKAQGYYDENYRYWFRGWRLILFPICLIIVGLVSILVFNQIILGVGAFFISIIGPFLAIGKLPLSEYGNKMKSDIDGFKNFLSDSPQEEINNLLKSDPKYFDKMLPFAVAFGLEKSFIPKFESHMNTPPIWYLSNTGVNNTSFSSFSESFDTEVIGSAFSSYPESSSGGHSSGGGFSSGGGIGGGGGGSW